MEANKHIFENEKRIYESALLTFKGVDGYDVYNCSTPFTYKGKTHLYGRVEKREEWANSHVRLFVETGKDEFTALPNLSWELEDPYVQGVRGEFVVGGTMVRKCSAKVQSYYGLFYRGVPDKNTYFTSGPNFMKDIRLVQLGDERIGVFSRKRTEEEVYIGFATIDTLDELGMTTIAQARDIRILQEGEWGGVNHAYLLDTGKIGCVGHYAYNSCKNYKTPQMVYINVSFILEPETSRWSSLKVIGTKGCYPPCPSKQPFLNDCAFTSGIVMREDGKCDLYSGLGDTSQGRITIDYPFEGYGEIVDTLSF